ncbi:unnamed protein product [Nippostrongylus brasiliensis]|uniref:Fe2OG dioxygenase domain-containing protein n=1 Tax=Nippostrongylus brasiliensis TaxID=27835 RepID=A0A0N4YUA7_NIPBR|nr:unnamed protein product [Nippostrongylus brasiliensis]
MFLSFRTPLFRILSYLRDGHYVPHFDYITYTNLSMADNWTKEFGNRFGTFMIVLQPATRGGGTVFPVLQAVVKPEPGDAIFWTNVDPSDLQEDRVLHGACPVWKGEKLAAVIWLRIKGQRLFHTALEHNRFDVKGLVFANGKGSEIMLIADSSLNKESTLKSTFLLHSSFSSRSEENVGDLEEEKREFVGAEYWTEDYLQQCNKAAPRYGEYSCYVLVRRYERLQIEVLSDNPVLMIFRDFVPSNFVKDFLSDVERKQMIEQTVVKSGDEKSSILSGTRRVNGSWFEHTETPGVEKMFRRVASFLPSVNFESSEPWQVLSYIPGGHYAPHHDFIDYSSPDMWDEWMRIYGNRFATLMVVLQSASRGGDIIRHMLNIFSEIAETRASRQPKTFRS